MTNKNRLLSLIIMCMMAVPGVLMAQRFLYKELIVIPVRPIDAHTFEAVENDGAGGTQIWCAAGKFTRDYLGQRGGDITVLRPRDGSETYPGRKSVIFTTLPTPSAFRSTSQGVRRAGQTFSMAHAYAICRSQYDRIVEVRVLSN